MTAGRLGSEYWKGGRHSSDVTGYIESAEEAVVSTLNITEVYFWVMRFYDESTAKKKSDVIEKRCYVVDVDEELTKEAAKI
ncbi:MAG: hypothetical protein ACRECH_10785 [Nitrososphaerales archaeon]